MKQSIRPFSEQGHYTEVHNLVFDYIMPRVSLKAFKVLCLILRRTKGWGKKNDEISYRQIKEGTGIKTNDTVSKALDELLDFGCILRRKSDEQFDTITYALNLKFEVPVEEIYEQNPCSKNEQASSKNEQAKPENASSKIEQGGGGASSKIEPMPCSKNEQAPSSKIEHTKAIYESSTNQNNKLGVVDKGGQKKSAASPEEIQSAVLEVLGETVNFKMGAFSPKSKTLLNSFVRAAVYQGRTADDVRVWRERLPHYLQADPENFTPPTLHQLVSTFSRVLEFQPKPKNNGVPSAAQRRAIAEKYKNQSREQP